MKNGNPQIERGNMIYFIQAGEDGPIKIGKTNNSVEHRLAQLQTGNSEELHLVWIDLEQDVTEEEIHTELKEHNIRGEWFHPKPVLDYIHTVIGNRYKIKTINANCILELFENFNKKTEFEEVTIHGKIEINGPEHNWSIHQDMMSICIDLSRINLDFVSILLPSHIKKENLKINRSDIKPKDKING